MKPKVVLVTAPFLTIVRPALGVSNLKAALIQRGIPTTVEYLSLRFADQIGVSLNEHIADGWPFRLMAGEWVFADLLRPKPDADRDRRYLEWVRTHLSEDEIRALSSLRAPARAFIDHAARELTEAQPALIGFSTMFHQNCASLAIAARIKALDPTIPICFGGANCESGMGAALLHAFPQIDYVFCGEADFTFPDFVTRLLRGDPDASSLPGVLARRTRQPSTKSGRLHLELVSEEPLTEAPPVLQMDDLPIPDFSDYFSALQATSFGQRVAASLVVETSRGCWWGAKHHCRFCGLNGTTMTYRTKSAPRILEELEALHRRYGIARFDAVDNIMDMKHIETVFDMLASKNAGYSFFYEVKSNLSREHLKRIARGGVTWIQPGVENLDDAILEEMEKGVRGLQNIRLLRDCRELGLFAMWHVLWGFPGELPHQYERIAAMVPLLEHLPPAGGCAKIRLDRFSPYFERAEALGFRNVRPAPAYEMIYDLPADVLHRMVYTFEGDRVEDPGGDYIRPLEEAIARWKRVTYDEATAPVLMQFEIDRFVVVKDTRSCATETWRCLEPEEGLVLSAFREPLGIDRTLSRHAGGEHDLERLRAAFSRLVSWKYLLVDGARALSLVVDPRDQVHGKEALADCPLGWIRPAP